MSLPDGKKDQKDTKSLLNKALVEYTRLLQTRPVFTKSLTNGVLSALGNLIAQFIAPDKATGGQINWRSICAYSSFGFFVTGPLFHHFYVYLDKLIPREGSGASLKRLFVDRFLFAPPFLLIFLYCLSILEGAGNKGAVLKIKSTYWMVLKLNWTIWSAIQFININLVPLKYRSLFGNVCGMAWMIFLSVKRRQ